MKIISSPIKVTVFGVLWKWAKRYRMKNINPERKRQPCRLLLIYCLLEIYLLLQNFCVRCLSEVAWQEHRQYQWLHVLAGGENFAFKYSTYIWGDQPRPNVSIGSVQGVITGVNTPYPWVLTLHGRNVSICRCAGKLFEASVINSVI